MRIIIISFVHWELSRTKNKKVSEIGLVRIYALPATHSRRTIVITCMFSCICGVSNCSIFVIWIWSWNLFTYFIASLRHHCCRTFWFWMSLLNMDVSFALMIVFHIVLISTHDSTIVFYFRCLMHYTIICVLINMVRWMQSALKTCGSTSISRL